MAGKKDDKVYQNLITNDNQEQGNGGKDTNKNKGGKGKHAGV